MKTSALVSKGSLGIVIGRSILSNGTIIVYDVSSGKVFERRQFQTVIPNDQMLYEINQSFIKHDILPGTCDVPKVVPSQRTVIVQHYDSSQADMHPSLAQQQQPIDDVDAMYEYDSEDSSSVS